MNKLIAFTIKFWSIFSIFVVGFGVLCFITYSINFISELLAFVFGCGVFIFLITLFVFFMVNVIDSLWYDLYQMSVNKNWNKNIQTFLKFLWEN